MTLSDNVNGKAGPMTGPSRVMDVPGSTDLRKTLRRWQ